MNNIVGVIFVLVGMFVFAVSVLGLYRFHYTLNRMHTVALADTLGTALVMIGLILLGLDIFHMLKLFLVLLFLEDMLILFLLMTIVLKNMNLHTKILVHN